MEKCDDGWFVGTSQRYRNDNGPFAFFYNLNFEQIRYLRHLPRQLRGQGLSWQKEIAERTPKMRRKKKKKSMKSL